MAHFVSHSPVYVIQAQPVWAIQETAVVAAKRAEKNTKQRQPVTISHSILKDNSAFFDLPALIDAGVHSFKIEGRIKGASYVHTVVDSFRKQIDGYIETGELTQDGERLYKVFNRDLTNAFLRGDLNQSMFIENPRDNSTNHVLAAKNAISVVQIYDAKQELQQERDVINATVFDKIKHLNIEKTSLSLHFSGEVGLPLTITAMVEEDGILPGAPSNTTTINRAIKATLN